MKTKIFIVFLFVLIFSLLTLKFLHADNAEVLPKGVSRVRLSSQLYFPVDKRFDPDGNEEDVASDYDNIPLNSSVFSDLRTVETFFGMPAGSATMGTSVVSLRFQFEELDFYYEYGVTDRLTIGIHIPYWWQRTKVDARLDSSTATVGKNASLKTIAPLDVPGTEHMTTEDIQNLLGQGLDINGDTALDVKGFGFKRFESWSGSGISDIEVGFRYQYNKTEDWRLAFTGAVRLPTGEVDDPDNLADYAFGEGAYALLFHFNNDYIAVENLVLNFTFRYELVLPDEEELRIPESVNQPITGNKEKVDRDLGDTIELEASGLYEFFTGFSLSLLYRYGFSFKDEVSGDQGFAYQSLEEETDYTEHIGIVDLSYSTIPLFKEKKFSIPLRSSISYRSRFAGSNNALKSEYIGLGLQIFF